jgi:hypothetical protein
MPSEVGEKSPYKAKFAGKLRERTPKFRLFSNKNNKILLLAGVGTGFANERLIRGEPARRAG